MDEGVRAALLAAAHTIARSRLSDAFGHLSIRLSPTTLAITPARPLGLLTASDQPIAIDMNGAELPPGAPKEAWIHLALMNGNPGVGAVCRAQPPHVAAFSALGQNLALLNGHAAVMGPVTSYADSRLVRDAAAGARVQEAIGDADIVILVGNGAVTQGIDVAHAVARMWLLERTAELNLRAYAAGTPTGISAAEGDWWRQRSSELLPRIYSYLTHTHTHGKIYDD